MKLHDFPIEFHAGRHQYTYKGELFPGVTTILNVRNKPFLMWWTVKEMEKFMSDKYKIIREPDFTKTKYNELLALGKKAHTKKSGDALDVGKAVHKIIEGYIATGSASSEDLADEKVNACFTQFLAWESKHEIKYLYSEKVVASLEHKFAGTLDFIAVIDGKVTIGDFKTSSAMSEEHFLQTGAYQLAIEEMGGAVDQRMIVRIPKDGTPVEELIVPTPYEFDKQTFLSLRQAHKWDVYIKNNWKGGVQNYAR